MAQDLDQTDFDYTKQTKKVAYFPQQQNVLRKRDNFHSFLSL